MVSALSGACPVETSLAPSYAPTETLGLSSGRVLLTSWLSAEMGSYRLPGEANGSERREKAAKVAGLEDAYAQALLKDHDVSTIARRLSAAEQVTHVDGQASLSINSTCHVLHVELSYLCPALHTLNRQYQHADAHVDGDGDDLPGAEPEPCALGQTEQRFLKNKDGWLKKKLIIRLSRGQACWTNPQTISARLIAPA